MRFFVQFSLESKLLIRKTKRRNALDDDDNDGRYETMRSITIISMQRVTESYTYSTRAKGGISAAS